MSDLVISVEWVPVGSMTIPRDTPPAKAIYEVEEELLKGAFKLYPKLKAFYEVRADKTDVFEYGHCLKGEEKRLVSSRPLTSDSSLPRRANRHREENYFPGKELPHQLARKAHQPNRHDCAEEQGSDAEAVIAPGIAVYVTN